MAAERLTIVGNTPTMDQWRRDATAPGGARPAGGMNLVYLGNLDGGAGVDVAVRAVAELKRMHKSRLGST